MRTINKKSGFTIIEVVMVLAIAGLIFAVVFAAVPRLQTSRRDNQRKRDMEQIAAAFTTYESNVGTYPTTGQVAEAFAGTTSSPFYSYIKNANFTDPSTKNNYSLKSTSALKEGEFYYLGHGEGYKCNSTNSHWETASHGGGFMLLFFTERGNVCIDDV